MVGLDRDNVLNGGFEKNDHYVLFFSGMVVFPLLSRREAGEKIYGFSSQNYIKSLKYPRKKRGMTFKWIESNLWTVVLSCESWLAMTIMLMYGEVITWCMSLVRYVTTV